jgi:hypothetical protein
MQNRQSWSKHGGHADGPTTSDGQCGCPDGGGGGGWNFDGGDESAGASSWAVSDGCTRSASICQNSHETVRVWDRELSIGGAARHGAGGSIGEARRGNPLFDPCPRRGLALRGSDCDQSRPKGGLPPRSLCTQHTHTRHARTRTPPAACCLPDSAPVFTCPLACPPVLPSACQHASPQAKHPPHSPLPYPLLRTQQEGTTTPRAATAAGRPPRTRRSPRTSLQVTPSPPPRS